MNGGNRGTITKKSQWAEQEVVYAVLSVLRALSLLTLTTDGMSLARQGTLVEVPSWLVCSLPALFVCLGGVKEGKVRWMKARQRGFTSGHERACLLACLESTIHNATTHHRPTHAHTQALSLSL